MSALGVAVWDEEGEEDSTKTHSLNLLFSAIDSSHRPPYNLGGGYNSNNTTRTPTLACFNPAIAPDGSDVVSKAQYPFCFPSQHPYHPKKDQSIDPNIVFVVLPIAVVGIAAGIGVVIMVTRYVSLYRRLSKRRQRYLLTGDLTCASSPSSPTGGNKKSAFSARGRNQKSCVPHVMQQSTYVGGGEGNGMGGKGPLTICEFLAIVRRRHVRWWKLKMAAIVTLFPECCCCCCPDSCLVGNDTSCPCCCQCCATHLCCSCCADGSGRGFEGVGSCADGSSSIYSGDYGGDFGLKDGTYNSDDYDTDDEGGLLGRRGGGGGGGALGGGGVFADGSGDGKGGGGPALSVGPPPVVFATRPQRMGVGGASRNNLASSKSLSRMSSSVNNNNNNSSSFSRPTKNNSSSYDIRRTSRNGAGLDDWH